MGTELNPQRQNQRSPRSTRVATSTWSAARGDPAPSVFRQETGMQKGEEHTKKGRGEGDGVLRMCACVCMCAQDFRRAKTSLRRTKNKGSMRGTEKRNKIFFCSTEGRRRNRVEKKAEGEKKARLPKPESKARMKVDRAIREGMHEEQHTSILFGLPSVTPLMACRAALLLQAQ